jgi:hypothetical protein
LEGIEKTTNVDIAGHVMDYIESRTFQPRMQIRRPAVAAA